MKTIRGKLYVLLETSARQGFAQTDTEAVAGTIIFLRDDFVESLGEAWRTRYALLEKDALGFSVEVEEPK